MNGRALTAIPRILEHEGGFVDHPDDPGGATNKGITIGTLKQLGIDVDGDGDSDIIDLKNMTTQIATKVYGVFYWDAVRADYLPIGLDYAVADYAVNSGPSRAAKELQRMLGVKDDGFIGPITLNKVRGINDLVAFINKYQDRRLSYLKSLRNKKTKKLLWDTFGKGWTARVERVRRDALMDLKTQSL